MTVPFLVPKRIGRERREALDRVDFYGSAGGERPDRVRLIETPGDAMNARIALLRDATETLDIAYYKIQGSECADALLGEMLLAADRGVRVRLLVDGKSAPGGSALAETLKALDSHPNIACRVYNPLRWLKPWTWNAAMHDKYILADGGTLLLGGRNIDERHFAPAGYEGPLTHDRDVLLLKTREGGAGEVSGADQVAAYFETTFTSAYTVSGADAARKSVEARPHYLRLRAAAGTFMVANPLFYRKTLAEYREEAMPAARVTLVHNPIHTRKKEPWAAYQLRRVALSAEERAMVQTPYATGNALLLAAMRDTAKRAELTVLTNSMRSSPNFPAFSNYYGQRHKFLRTGAKLYEYQRDDSIHGKSLAVDGRLSAVGSFNLDDRSMYIDTETMLVIDSPAFAAELEGAMEHLRQDAARVEEDDARTGLGKGDHPPELRAKERVMQMFGLLLRPFRYLL